MTEQGFKRENNRQLDKKREINIETGYLTTNPYSVMISVGNTKVLCAATTDNWTPPHIRNTDRGWISAQYSMLPNSSEDRIRRERVNVKGRTKEIERLIGRALRSVCDLRAIPYESIIVDCDVIQADGGTRTASVTGGFVALYMLVKDLQRNNRISRSPVNDFLAAISVGVVHGKAMLDLNSSEDKIAQVDMNLVMTDSGRLSEIQATGEEATFKIEDFNRMMELAKEGIIELIKEQKRTLNII
ncbi:MAG: ribonuclease PH [Elusimicrobia bacterium]|jgi:ribonuclease PH|nr:ribonuclease PH [Elusimicrobiota bacterium]